MKLKPDVRSINFKTFVYFVLFAGTLMLLLWALQVLFLNNFYGIMKSSQTKTVASELQHSYLHKDQENFFLDISNLSRSYDLNIYVITYSGGLPILVYTTPGDDIRDDYSTAIQSLYGQIREDGIGSAELDQTSGTMPKKMFAYASVLNQAGCGDDYEDAVVLYVFSPLRPVTSTVKIMTTILIYVTIISLILACILSLYLSTRITRPIRKITRSAERLAHGEYGVVFKGGHYTEINNLADTLNSASIGLEKSDLMQKDLIANVSHDLRTPLTMIRSYAEMIRDISGENPEKRDQHLQVIIDESDRLNNLVEDLLTVSRLQSGKLSLEQEEFSLTDTVSAIVSTYDIMADQGYRFTVDCPLDFIVYGDRDKIRQVVTNLMTNAIKFCGNDRLISVSLKKRGRAVRFSVEDHGPGIAAEDLDHIWERYYRSSSNMVRSAEGSGLGLSIVKEILTLHKASFGADSTLGQGSTFWFEMDIVRAEKLTEEDNPNG
ncbi:MAG: HAMP domain-containing sensor histidine kinase [Bacillota bacterium]|nr:HAMP domain-containing sensor histidine kinase [Bacillota bacterium]